MDDRARWLYLLAGLAVGGAAVFAFDRFPGGRGEGGTLEVRYQEGRTYMVRRVLDGDTIVVEPGIRVRYAGINTPETTRIVEEPEPFALEAKEANQKLVAGREVRIVPSPTKFDHWGRLLAGVEVRDPESGQWVDVEEELLKAGLARRVTYAGAVRNEVRLKRAEEAAKAAGVGLWPSTGGRTGSYPRPSAPKSHPEPRAPNQEP